MYSKFKSFFRDIPVGLFMIAGMGLIFFLVLNSINLANAIKNEKDHDDDNKFRYSKIVNINLDEDLYIQEDGSTDASFSARNYIDEMIKLCKKYQGNVLLSIPLWDDYDSSENVDIYLNINEPVKIELENGDCDTIDSLGKASKGVYVAQSKKNLIKTRDGKDLIWLQNSEMNVLGIRKDFTYDMSDKSYITFIDSIDKYHMESIYSMGSFALSQGDPMVFIFESNKDDTLDSYNNIVKSLKDKGYIVTEHELSGEDIDERQSGGIVYKDIMDKITMLLIIFAVINCVYITRLWISRKKVEITIRKAYGQSTLKIGVMLAGQLVRFCVVSMVLAFVIQLVYRQITSHSGMYVVISFMNVIEVLSAMLLLIIIMMIIPLFELKKIKPATGVREV